MYNINNANSAKRTAYTKFQSKTNHYQLFLVPFLSVGAAFVAVTWVSFAESTTWTSTDLVTGLGAGLVLGTDGDGLASEVSGSSFMTFPSEISHNSVK
jgi:hypothetical protein